MTIPEVIEKLKEKSEINPHKGKGGSMVLVDKELLRLASVFLEDYLESYESYGDRKTESNSEKPNNSTISKMEQVEGEPQKIGYCNECKWYGDKQVCGRCRSRNLYAPKTEPQTCSVNGRPYDCGNCEYFKCTADEPQTEVYDYKGNGKWERSE